jgi:hypothetical protein
LWLWHQASANDPQLFSDANNSLCRNLKEKIFAGEHSPVICDREMYYVLKKYIMYHVIIIIIIIIIKEGQQAIYNVGKRLTAV